VRPRIAAILFGIALLAAGCDAGRRPCIEPEPVDLDWPQYGGDAGGQRHSPAVQIDRSNVAELEIAWQHHSGDVSDGRGDFHSKSSFEATPILVERTLYLCTPMNRVIALDPVTGTELWNHDPRIDRAARYANDLVCRGVAAWRDPAGPQAGACARRIFSATNDARLIALDAATGRPCPDFGVEGEVDLNPGVGEQERRGEYQVTSPPLVAGELVVVGSAITDNNRVDVPSGVVRAFDARTGALRWAWDVAPPGPLPAGRAQGTGWALGSPNVWAPMALDAARDLLFVPTGNPSPDYFGGLRRALEPYASSLVALRASTGEVVWHFQTVHHDLWDYDVASQPTLVDLERDGVRIPAVVQATKMGLLFVLERETGAPLFGVEERPVPQTDVPGETTSPTQPFPLRPPPLVSHRMTEADVWGLTPLERRSCRERLSRVRNEGIYTPPGLGSGSLMYPGNAGGSNWGGIAVDPGRALAVANVNQIGFLVALYPGQEFERAKAGGGDGAEYAPQRGTPYALRRAPFLSSIGAPCSPLPWGKLVAVDLARGEVRWEVRLGTLRDMLPLPLPIEVGTPNLGGPLLTASGLVFIGAALDDYLRAFDAQTGEELWRGRLPAGGQATPMSYVIDGWQYVVIAAGGHGRMGTRAGDALVAFSLPAELRAGDQAACRGRS
jgi:quinoprotein glucose dehydrogenase